MSDNVRAEIHQIFVDHFFEPEAQRPLLDQLSSLELVHLVTELEKRFKVSIGALEINESSFKDFQSLAEFIQRKSGS
jgi:acyl carrier protein